MLKIIVHLRYSDWLANLERRMEKYDYVWILEI